MSELVEHIKKKMFYMNPVLSLLDYSIYECTGINAITKKEYLGTFYFLIKGKSISNKNIGVQGVQTR